MGSLFSKSKTNESAPVASAAADGDKSKKEEEAKPEQKAESGQEDSQNKESDLTPSVQPAHAEEPQPTSAVQSTDAVGESNEKKDDVELLVEASTTPIPLSPQSPPSPPSTLNENAAEEPKPVNVDLEESNGGEFEHIPAEPQVVQEPSNKTESDYPAPADSASEDKKPDDLVSEQKTTECEELEDEGAVSDLSSPSQMVAPVVELAEEMSKVVISTAAQECGVKDDGGARSAEDSEHVDPVEPTDNVTGSSDTAPTDSVTGSSDTAPKVDELAGIDTDNSSTLEVSH